MFELDWNSKLLWNKYHKTPFIPFVDGHIFTLLFIYFQKEVIMVSQMSQWSFVLHSPGTWQRRSAACVTPCSVFSPDQFVFFVAKVKNVHVLCTSRKIMGIKSPLKVFSAARQKIVLQMGASDEREARRSGYDLHWRFLSRVITFYLPSPLLCAQMRPADFPLPNLGVIYHVALCLYLGTFKCFCWM